MEASSKIKIKNLNRRFKLNERYLGKIIRQILSRLDARPLDLEVVFLDNRKIRSLNRKYRNRDRATDVLSFGIGTREFGSAALLAEICVSIDKAYVNSKAFGTEFEKELILYVIHGILHLAGYNDRKAKDKARMEKKQEEILTFLCRKLDLSRVLMPR